MPRIRQRLSLFSLAVLLIFSGAAAQADLMTRERHVRADGSETVITSKQKGNRVRVDTEGVDVSIIVEEASENFHVLLHSSREYLIVNALEFEAKQKAKNPGQQPSGEVPAPQSLGKTEQLGEFSADIYQIRYKTGDITLEYLCWVVKDHPQASTFGDTERILQNSGVGEIHKGPSTVGLGFPAVILKSEFLVNGERQEIVTLEAVSDEVLDEALFSPPADYVFRQQ